MVLRLSLRPILRGSEASCSPLASVGSTGARAGRSSAFKLANAYSRIGVLTRLLERAAVRKYAARAPSALCPISACVPVEFRFGPLGYTRRTSIMEYFKLTEFNLRLSAHITIFVRL